MVHGVPEDAGDGITKAEKKAGVEHHGWGRCEERLGEVTCSDITGVVPGLHDRLPPAPVEDVVAGVCDDVHKAGAGTS